jgi:hypothetical protein
MLQTQTQLNIASLIRCRLSHEVGMTGHTEREYAWRFLSRDDVPCYTSESLLALIKRTKGSLITNQDDQLEHGLPRIPFIASPWLHHKLLKLYPTRAPSHCTLRRISAGETLDHVETGYHWDNKPVDGALSTCSLTDIWLGSQLGARNTRTGEIGRPVDLRSRALCRPQLQRLSEYQIRRIERLRAQVHSFKIDAIEMIARAIQDKSTDLADNITEVLGLHLTMDDVEFLIDIDSVCYAAPELPDKLLRPMWPAMTPHEALGFGPIHIAMSSTILGGGNGGIVDIIRLAGHIELESRFGVYGDVAAVLEHAQPNMQHTYESSRTREIDDALDGFIDIQSDVSLFWPDFMSRLHESMDRSLKQTVTVNIRLENVTTPQIGAIERKLVEIADILVPATRDSRFNLERYARLDVFHDSSDNAFYRDGNNWNLCFQGTHLGSISHRKIMYFVHHLLSHPNQSVSDEDYDAICDEGIHVGPKVNVSQMREEGLRKKSAAGSESEKFNEGTYQNILKDLTQEILVAADEGNSAEVERLKAQIAAIEQHKNKGGGVLQDARRPRKKSSKASNKIKNNLLKLYENLTSDKKEADQNRHDTYGPIISHLRTCIGQTSGKWSYIPPEEMHWKTSS